MPNEIARESVIVFTRNQLRAIAARDSISEAFSEEMVITARLDRSIPSTQRGQQLRLKTNL
jgi:hypothetical protein